MTNALIIGLALMGLADGPPADEPQAPPPAHRKRFHAGAYATTSHGVGLNAMVLVRPLDAPESDDPDAGFVPVAQFQLCWNPMIRPGVRGSARVFDPLAISLPGRFVNPTLVLAAHPGLLNEGWDFDRLIAEGVPPEDDGTRVGMRPGERR